VLPILFPKKNPNLLIYKLNLTTHKYNLKGDTSH
jgi:hypothetical protein